MTLIPTRPVRRLSLLALLAAALPAFADTAPLQPADYAAAARKQDGIPSPYEVIAAPELGAVFAASAPGGDGAIPGDVYMMDGGTLAPLRRIQLPRRPFALAMDHARGWLYAGNTKDGSLTVIDAKSGLPLRVIQLGKPGEGGKMEHTRMIEVDEATGRVFVTGPTNEGIVWIVDGPGGKVLHRSDDVGIWAAGLAFDGKDRLYVGGGGAEEIAILDAGTGERLGSFSTGDTPPGAGGDSAHFFVNLSLDRAGGRLFAVDSHAGRLYVWDTATGTVLAQVPIGIGALDVIFSPARNEAYVTYYGINQTVTDGRGGLMVIDGETYAVKRHLAVPTFPSNLALGDRDQVLFLSVTQPSREDHPDYRPDATGTVLRLDLDALGDLP